MEFIVKRYLDHLESYTLGLTPKELYKLGYMWAEDEEIQIATGPENFEFE